MRKLLLLGVMILGISFTTQAQFAIEANAGATFSNGDGKFNSTGESLANAFTSQVAASYDFYMDSSFHLAPEARFLYESKDFVFQPGINIGHDNLYAKIAYNTDESHKEFLYGIAADAELSMIAKNLFFVPMIQYGHDSHVYTVTGGLKYKF